MSFSKREDEILERLQAWFGNRCDGVWEHTSGIKIETTDNPGWLITIDLRETGLSESPRILRASSATDMGWLDCRINDQRQFVGAGDPTKLVAILAEFERFTESSRDT